MDTWDALKKHKMTCPLCRLHVKREISTKLYWEDKTCIVVDCKSCGVPMLVLKRHIKVPTHEERLHMINLADKLFPRSYKRFTNRRIFDHFHFHVQEAFKKPLELGGGEGPRYHPNVDIRDIPTVDKVADVSIEGIPYESNMFDIVWNQHFLEHIPRHRLKFVLQEILRVLEPGGMVEIIVPDFRIIAERLVKQNVLIGTKEVDVCCGSQSEKSEGIEDYLPYDTHYNIFTYERLKGKLEENGFVRVELIPPRPEWLFDDLHVIAFKPKDGG